MHPPSERSLQDMALSSTMVVVDEGRTTVATFPDIFKPSMPMQRTPELLSISLNSGRGPRLTCNNGMELDMVRLGVGMPITIDVGDDVCTTSAPCVDARTPTSMPRHSVEHLVSISMVSPLIVVLMASAATATKPKSVTISSAMSNASDAGSYVDASLVVVALILDARTYGNGRRTWCVDGAAH